MRFVDRFAHVVQMTALLGPSNLLSLALAAGLAGALFSYRLLSLGYHRCFLTTR